MERGEREQEPNRTEPTINLTGNCCLAVGQKQQPGHVGGSGEAVEFIHEAKSFSLAVLSVANKSPFFADNSHRRGTNWERQKSPFLFSRGIFPINFEFKVLINRRQRMDKPVPRLPPSPVVLLPVV